MLEGSEEWMLVGSEEGKLFFSGALKLSFFPALQLSFIFLVVYSMPLMVHLPSKSCITRPQTATRSWLKKRWLTLWCDSKVYRINITKRADPSVGLRSSDQIDIVLQIDSVLQIRSIVFFRSDRSLALALSKDLSKVKGRGSIPVEFHISSCLKEDRNCKWWVLRSTPFCASSYQQPCRSHFKTNIPTAAAHDQSKDYIGCVPP